MIENMSEDEQAKSEMKSMTGSFSVAASDISDDLRGDPIKNGHILPTGQWYAPSAVKMMH